MTNNSLKENKMKSETTPVESENHHLVINSSNLVNSIRTYVIFLDIPKHLEIQIDQIPLLQVNDTVEFDLKIKDPRNLDKIWKINGPYLVSKRILKYCSDNSKLSGLTQYLEFKPVD